MELIPVYAVAITATLVVLEVAEERRLDGDVEIVGLVRAEGHETTTH